MGTPFKECPVCGAHLDANERCDCGADGQNETRKPHRMKLVVICREIDKETGRIAVYRVPAKIDDHVIFGLKIRARASPELRYFALTDARWEMFGEAITGILKRRVVTAADVERIGGIVEL